MGATWRLDLYPLELELPRPPTSRGENLNSIRWGLGLRYNNDEVKVMFIMTIIGL